MRRNESEVRLQTAFIMAMDMSVDFFEVEFFCLRYVSVVTATCEAVVEDVILLMAYSL